MQADPDAFVLLFPVTWSPKNKDAVADVHEELWVERMTVDFDDEPPADAPDDLRAAGRLHLEGARVKEPDETIPVAVEPPIDQLEGATQTAKEPFTASEQALVEQHRAIWRVVVQGGTDRGATAAQTAARLMQTFVEAGAAGAFLPATAEIHSPSLIRNQTQNLQSPQSMTNLFVSAWDDGDWMMTRGLTCFGLPELETRIDSGVNDAFFRLMDVACNMIIQGESFPLGANLRVGHQSFRLEEGRRGPDDEKVPVAGHFGVHTVLPAQSASG